MINAGKRRFSQATLQAFPRVYRRWLVASCAVAFLHIVWRQALRKTLDWQDIGWNLVIACVTAPLLTFFWIKRKVRQGTLPQRRAQDEQVRPE